MLELQNLIDAAKTGDLSRVEEMLGARPVLALKRLSSGETALMSALYHGQKAVVEALVRHGAVADVFSAAATGQLPELHDALRDEEAVHAYSYDGWTPLHLAAFFGRLDAARVLLESGADVHAVSRNSLANTPLHAATAGKHADIALLLLKHGANPDTPDAGGHSARHIAAENKLEAVTRTLAGRAGGSA
jgi:ankyrin repeat protein